MNEFRLFLATPFLVVAKVFAFIAELVSGFTVEVKSLAQMISDGDADVVKISIHDDLMEEFEESMENLEEGDDPFEILMDLHERSKPLFKRDGIDVDE